MTLATLVLKPSQAKKLGAKHLFEACLLLPLLSWEEYYQGA